MVMESTRFLESKLIFCTIVGVPLANLLSRIMLIVMKTKQPIAAFFISLKSRLFNQLWNSSIPAAFERMSTV